MGIEANQQHYLDAVRRRVKRADAAVISRVVGVQVAWIVSLVCGAGVALVQAVGDQVSWIGSNAGWIAALLGFAVVVAQGADKLITRTSSVVRADDAMRRNIAREQRLFQARAGDYATAAEPFELFVSRAEAELAAHDRGAVDYSATLLSPGE